MRKLIRTRLYPTAVIFLLMGLDLGQEGESVAEAVFAPTDSDECQKITSDSVLGHPASPKSEEESTIGESVSIEGKDNKTETKLFLQGFNHQNSQISAAESQDTKKTLGPPAPGSDGRTMQTVSDNFYLQGPQQSNLGLPAPVVNAEKNSLPTQTTSGRRVQPPPHLKDFVL